MKILDNGHWNDNWSREKTCTNKDCKAKLLLEKDDVKFDGDDYHYYCPVCGQWNVLQYNEVHPRVRTLAVETRREHEST